MLDLFGNNNKSNFSNSSDEPFKYGGIEIIRSDIRRKWEEALIKEQFAYPNMYIDNLGKNKLDCSHEIEDMYSHAKITAFFENSEYDRVNRMRILANYLHQSNWSNKALNKATIPYSSFMRTLIEKKSRLYSKPATRMIEDKSCNDIYQELIEDANINAKMRYIQQLVKAHDMVAVRPLVSYFDEDDEYKLSYDVITPDKFRIQLSADLSRITKILYESQILNEEQGYYEDIIVVWTPTEHYYWTVMGEKGLYDDSGKNPYGRIPFVIFRQNDDGQLYSSGAIEILHANLRYNHAVLNSDYDSDISCMNVFVGKNLPMGRDAELHPGDVFIVMDGSPNKDESTQIEGRFVSTTPFFDKYQLQAKEIYKEIAMAQGIPGYMFSETIQEISGKAVKNSMIMLTDEMERDRLIFTELERKLALMTAHVANYHISVGQLMIPSLDIDLFKKEFYIDYQEDSYDDDPQKDFNLDQQKVQAGIKSIVAWIQKENPDITSEEEALEFYHNNQVLLDEFSKQGFKFYFESQKGAAPTSEEPTVAESAINTSVEDE